MATLNALDWLRYYPLRLSLVFFGLVLVLFSLNAQGYGFASASLSQNEFWMQPGSDVRAQVNVKITSSQLVPISFSINQVEGITIDGALQGLSTTGNFSRQVRIDVSPNVPPGDYSLQLTMHASLDGQTYHYPFPIIVHVSQKERVVYFTSSNSTLSPSIQNIQLSPQTITLHRGEVQYAHVSFRNVGNATDYAIEFNPKPIGLFASILTPNHSFVDAGEVVQSDIEFRAFASSPFEKMPISIYARNRVTQEKMFLGIVNVSIEKINHALLSIPFAHMELGKGESQQSFLTIQNTEASDLDLLVQTSSPSVELSSTQLHIPAKSSLSIPFTVHGGNSLGTRVESIYAFNSEYELSTSFSLATIPAVISSGEVETRTLSAEIENDSGIEWKNITLQLRNLPSTWKAQISPQNTSLLQGDSLTATIQLIVPQKESATFTFLVYNEGILVKTISVKSIPNPTSFTQISGFVSGVGRPFIGLVILILAALLIFSADFRNRIRGSLPKPKPIVKEAKVVSPAKEDNPVAPASVVPAAELPIKESN